MSLEDLGRQSSMEAELQGVKRELYDSKEREADIMDQLHFVQDDEKMLQKKVTMYFEYFIPTRIYL